jgi:hypothetical protein
MSTAEAILKKVSALPREKQERVLDYVKSISEQHEPPVKSGKPYEWIDIALKANLQGPPDWSERFEDYLDGGVGETGR